MWTPIFIERAAIEAAMQMGGLLEADRINKEKINASKD